MTVRDADMAEAGESNVRRGDPMSLLSRVGELHVALALGIRGSVSQVAVTLGSLRLR